MIFVCIDALRADHLGVYGYDRDTSPFLDELARDGILFTQARSHSSWTKTSTATFLTSSYASLNITNKDIKLPASMNTLAETLKNHGYATGAFVANPWILPEAGFEQGFDVYNTKEVYTELKRIKIGDILRFTGRHTRQRFFLYIHFMDVHNPYAPPSPYNSMFTQKVGPHQYRNGLIDISNEELEHAVGLYDGEIRYLDEKIRLLFEGLNRQGILENTLILFNADHGDEFLEHGGMGHGTTLYQEVLHTPFFIAHNERLGLKQSVIHTLVRNIDIYPTILDILHISPTAAIDGISLLPAITGEKNSSLPDAAFASMATKSTRDGLAALSNKENHSYIHNMSQNISELYNLKDDPREQKNLIGNMTDTALTLQSQLSLFEDEYLDEEMFAFSKVSLDRQTLKQLKSLGYTH
ncbi:MAG: sulfatase [bacterium]|nr:sulfatase [bacterium]